MARMEKMRGREPLDETAAFVHAPKNSSEARDGIVPASARRLAGKTRCAGSLKAAGAYYISTHGYAMARCGQCEHMGRPTRDGRISTHRATRTPNDAWSSHPRADLVTVLFKGSRPGAEDMADLFIEIFHDIKTFDDGGHVLMLSHDNRSITALVQRP
jgi:hypothetical protein